MIKAIKVYLAEINKNVICKIIKENYFIFYNKVANFMKTNLKSK
jgi:hypothetical protein